MRDVKENGEKIIATREYVVLVTITLDGHLKSERSEGLLVV